MLQSIKIPARRKVSGVLQNKTIYSNKADADSSVEDSDFENIELDNVMNIDILNDVCSTVHNRLIVLMEHRSALNQNMPVRMFLYTAEEYKRLPAGSEFSSAFYASALVKIPGACLKNTFC